VSFVVIALAGSHQTVAEHGQAQTLYRKGR